MIKRPSILSLCRRKTGIGLMAGLLAFGLTPEAMAADLYGFVVGINDYQHEMKLDGAVNDARDVATSLKEAGAKEVILLVDQEADRDTLIAKWKEIIAKAKPGDVLVFHYAGHGSQEPERVAGSEADGLNENFLLAGFAPKDKESYQRIVDDEMEAMFREAAHLKILFIADSCHSGTMTRSFSKAPKKIKHRSVPALQIENDAIPVLYGAKSRSEGTTATATGSQGGADGAVASHVLGFSAVADHELDPEITVDGQQRAALSVALGKALRGAANTNADREITKKELEHFITENVRMMTEGQQHPQVYGSDNFSIPVNTRSIRLVAAKGSGTKPAAGQKEQTPAAATAPDNKPVAVKVFISNVPATLGAEQWKPMLGQVQQSDTLQNAQLVWDLGEEKIISQLGDVIYHGRQPKIQETRAFTRAKSAPAPAPGTDLSYAAKVFEKIMAVERIKQRSEAASPVMTLKPGDKLFRAGQQVSLETSGQLYPYLTLFNMASDGTINNLYPLKDGTINDPLDVPVNKPNVLELNVEAPYGADHFVAIFSDKPLAGLHGELGEMNGRKSADRIESALDRHLSGAKYQIGIHGVYSGP